MSGDLTRYRELILFDGSTFFISDLSGDVPPESTQGYFRDDVRHLSRWRLLVDGEGLEGSPQGRSTTTRVGSSRRRNPSARPTRCAATASSPTACTRTSWSRATSRKSRS